MDSLRFSDALHSIGTSEGTLRQWLHNGKVKLERGYGRDWARFTTRDIAHLAVTRVLAVDFNIEVAEAFKIAQAAIQQGRQPRAKVEGEEFWRGWEGHSLILRRDDKGEWLFKRVSIGGLEFAPKSISKRVVDVAPRSISKRVVNVMPGNFLNIDVEQIVKSALDRALESAKARAEKRRA
jgi:hypothetical protein